MATKYCVELYDKDNDYFEQVEYFAEEQDAYNLCYILAKLIKKDMLVNRFNGRVEPFDHVQVRDVSNNMILMINDDLELPF